MTGSKVELFLKSELKKKKALLFVLIDSEVSQLKASSKLAKDVEKIGASAILVGGSSATDQIEMAQVVKGIKKGIKIPLILFPGNVTGVVPDADAILFSSLMNSENPYFITQAQALGAPSVLKFGLEPLPTAYLVIGEGTSAWFSGSAISISCILETRSAKSNAIFGSIMPEESTKLDFASAAFSKIENVSVERFE